MLAIQPKYVSVTFGAGGSTRAGTADAVRTLRNLGCDAAPHLSCVGASRQDLRDILQAYKNEGVRRVVARAATCRPAWAATRASCAMPTSWCPSSARKPATGSTSKWRPIPKCTRRPPVRRPTGAFRGQVRAGANAAITQYFFNADAYFDFVDRAQAKGVNVPIVPGIMPITNHSQLLRFGNVRRRSAALDPSAPAEFGDDKASIRAFGVDVVTELCQTLLDNGAPGVHFYTLNHAEAPMAIWRELSR